MRAQPYLCLGGVELGNALRTYTYLRRGLGGSQWEVHTSNADQGGCETTTEVADDGYTDIYPDVYPGSIVSSTVCEPFWAGNLSCYCEALDEGPWVDPATDDAPWYVAGLADSEEFLGFIPSDIRVRPQMARSAVANGLGASIGQAVAGGQLVTVEGVLVAASGAGMAYGERWLQWAASGALCDDDPSLSFLPACPPAGEPARWRNLPHIGLVDDIVFAGVHDDLPECKIQRVTMQLGSESPWLLSDTESLLAGGALSDNTPNRFLITTDVCEAGLRLQVDASGTDLLDVRCYAQVTAGACPPDGTVMPAWDFTLPVLPAGHRFVVDATERIAEVTIPPQGRVVSGREALSYGGAWVWPQVAPCAQLCVTLIATEAAGGHWWLDRVDREF